MFSEAERFAPAGFLAGYRGLTQEAVVAPSVTVTRICLGYFGADQPPDIRVEW